MSDVGTILAELGISFRVSGTEAFSTCPFHNPEGLRENHVSFSVSMKNGTYYCFSCGAKGNLAHLMSRLKGMPYPLAVIEVNGKIGWAKADAWREDYENKNFAPPTFKISETDLALFTDVPQDVLEGRGIEPEQAKLFGVRWNTDNRSWILPIRDPNTNELWGWQEKFNDTRLFRNYPSGIKKSKTLFGLDAFADGSTITLVESPLDAVRVSAFGRGSGLASSGLQISNQQLSIVFDRSNDVVLALDNDSAGVRETTRICREYLGQGKITVFSYEFSDAKDPGDMSDKEIELGYTYQVSALRWLREHNV